MMPHTYPCLNKTQHHTRTDLLLLLLSDLCCSSLHYSVHLSGETAASKWQFHKHLWENLIGTNYLLVVWDLRSHSSYFSQETPGEGVASFQKNELRYSLNKVPKEMEPAKYKLNTSQLNCCNQRFIIIINNHISNTCAHQNRSSCASWMWLQNCYQHRQGRHCH